MQNIYDFISYVSLGIGMIGMFALIIGVVKSICLYIKKIQIHKIRLFLGEYLILSLDFLLGKDIIDTLLLIENGNGRFFERWLGLVTIVIIRIVLTHFIMKEMNDISKNEKILNEIDKI